MGAYFNSDRFYKYGYGVLRLALVALLAFQVRPSDSLTNATAALSVYYHSWRWLGHAYIGIIGAAVNVNVASFRINLLMLLAAGAFCAWDVHSHDLSSVIYLMKTFGGDFFAGKLDTTEWRLVLLFVFGLFGPAVVLTQESLHDFASSYVRILAILFLLQLFCEYGDNHMEHYKFFRHRYSYEVTGLALVLLVPLRAHELAVVQFDMVICLFYRISNLTIIILVNAYVSKFFVSMALKVHSFAIGIPVVLVSDPELAALVLRESNKKGEALEKYCSVPAWKPIVSLESEDGAVWKEMSRNFHDLLQRLPPVAHLSEIAHNNVASLKLRRGDAVIDANDLVRLTIETYLEYVLHCTWRPEFEIFVEASWQWRKEIAIKGKGDVAVKEKAIDVFVKLLKETDPFHSLWGLHGDKWYQPEYYSLILQPFIISPSINVGDIMVAVQLSPPGTCLETAMRQLHPFPLFERYVDRDISLDGGKTVAIKAHTQVEMFLADFKDSTKWPIFGGGERMCAGRHLALPYLKILFSDLSSLPNFDPNRNHLYSGRGNDNNLTLGETLFFLNTIFTVILRRLYTRVVLKKV